MLYAYLAIVHSDIQKMQLTRQTDFAFRTLLYLAAQPEEELQQIRHICTVFDISSNHLSKVVNKLANLGYIESHRGRGGGIRLGKEPGKINVGEVVRAMEPTLRPINCSALQCVLLPGCQLKTLLAEASDAFIHTLDQHTLEDLVQSDIKVLRGLG